MSKNWTWKTTRVSCDQKLSCFGNLGKNTCNKIVKSDKTGQEKKVSYLFSQAFQPLLPKSNFLKGNCTVGYEFT